MADEVLRSQYARAVEEYRFQVELNWRRSEYFFVLNIGVLIAASTMLSSGGVPRGLVAVLFGVGALLAFLSFLANDVQHGYYRSARDQKKDLEDRLELGDLALATTTGQGSGFARLGRVGTFLKIMLVAIAAADLVGVGLAIEDALGSSADGTAREAIVGIAVAETKGDSWSAIVVSRNGEPVRTKALTREGASLVALGPGRYLVSAIGTSICERGIQVGRGPAQVVLLRC